MKYNQDKEFVSVQWVVKHYAKNADGSLGDYLTVIPDYTKETIADNTTMCDVNTGIPIEKNYPTTDLEGNQVLDYDPNITYTGQYDFFAYVAEMKDIKVNKMIRDFGLMVTDWSKK